MGRQEGIGRSIAEGKEAGGGHRPVWDFDAQAEHLFLEGAHVLAEWAAEVVEGRAQRLALGQTQHQHQRWWGPIRPPPGAWCWGDHRGDDVGDPR